MKHILVSITCGGRLHWRLISAQPQGKHWAISQESWRRFLDDIGQNGQRIIVG